MAIGEEFGLGVLVKVLRNRKFPAMTGWGALLGLVTLIIGLPVTGGVAAGSYQAATKVLVAVVFGALFLFSCLLVGRGVSRSHVEGRLFRYSGGLAQLVRDNPEPLVVRWADADTFTVSVSEPDEANAYLTGFTLHSATGTSLPGLRRYRRPELHDLVTWIGKALIARLVPGMTERYESGEPVVFGKVRVDQTAITVDTWGSGPEVITWTDISWITVAHLPQSDAMRIPQRITIARKAGHGAGVEIELSGVPNGIFLPLVLAHAAGRNSILVYGYEESSPDPKAPPAAQAPPVAPTSPAAPPLLTAPTSFMAPPPSTAPISFIAPPPSEAPGTAATPASTEAEASSETEASSEEEPRSEEKAPSQTSVSTETSASIGAPTAPFWTQTTPSAQTANPSATTDDR